MATILVKADNARLLSTFTFGLILFSPFRTFVQTRITIRFCTCNIFNSTKLGVFKEPNHQPNPSYKGWVELPSWIEVSSIGELTNLKVRVDSRNLHDPTQLLHEPNVPLLLFFLWVLCGLPYHILNCVKCRDASTSKLVGTRKGRELLFSRQFFFFF